MLVISLSRIRNNCDEIKQNFSGLTLKVDRDPVSDSQSAIYEQRRKYRWR
jgi:hypothetical protein